MKKIFLLTFIAFLFFSLVPSPSQAALVPLVPCGGTGQPTCNLCHLFVLFDSIIDFVLFKIVLPIAVLMLVIGGVMFFAAMGNPEKLTTAKSLITSVVIGLVIIFAAWLLVTEFFSVIGISATGPLKELLTDPGAWSKINCPI